MRIAILHLDKAQNRNPPQKIFHPLSITNLYMVGEGAVLIQSIGMSSFSPQRMVPERKITPGGHSTLSTDVLTERLRKRLRN